LGYSLAGHRYAAARQRGADEEERAVNDSKVEQAIAETAERAKSLLAEEKRIEDTGAHFAILFDTASRMQSDAQTYTRQSGSSWSYSPSLASVLLLPMARQDYYFDKSAGFFAAVMLDATGSIPDPQLRSHICGRLIGAFPEPKRDKRKSRNHYRDSVIVTLILSLQPRFAATRSQQNEECGCSIVSAALKQIGHWWGSSEDRVKKIWLKLPSEHRKRAA
jgi:hypothetical protein